MTLRVIFMGTPDFSVLALQALAHACRVVGVYSQPPRTAGRGQAERPTPVHQEALRLGLPVFTPLSLKNETEQAAFAALNADVAVVAAYGLILPKAILDAPRLGCVNIHASLLPRWRGAAPIQRAILAGDQQTGITLMQMDVGLDTGGWFLMEKVAITPETTGQTLHDELSALGARMVVPALHRLSQGNLPATPQPSDGVTYAQKIDKAEARIDWQRPAEQIDRQIRAFSPFPGAWFDLGGERVKVLMSQKVPGAFSATPGTLLDDQFLVQGGGGQAVRLLTLQRAGRSPLSAAEFSRGRPIPRGERLG